MEPPVPDGWPYSSHADQQPIHPHEPPSPSTHSSSPSVAQPALRLTAVALQQPLPAPPGSLNSPEELPVSSISCSRVQAAAPATQTSTPSTKQPSLLPRQPPTSFSPSEAMASSAATNSASAQ